MYYFLEEDFKDLNEKIIETINILEKIGKEMGESTTQSSETWHDNFGFEEAKRQYTIFHERLNELTDIRNRAKIVSADLLGNAVAIGKVVVLKDENTGKVETYKIGSYMIFKRLHGYVSYSAPLAKIILGAKAGEAKEGEIGGKKKIFKILTVI
ncbi:MAG: Transcription elongation factor GreA [Parcubacteria group bacterium GW2011_GWA2_40_143]|nr:MAG: Transcription elongation factor GreA [Parcubacteria group bacterium GW2011_GWA2_40_143]